MEIALLATDAERFLHWAPPWAPGAPSAEPRAWALQDWFGRLEEGASQGRPGDGGVGGGSGGAFRLDMCVKVDFVERVQAGQQCLLPVVRHLQTLGRTHAPAG